VSLSTPGPTAPELRRSQRAGSNFELYAWVFMRVSGALLVLLILLHLTIMLVLDRGIGRVDFAFVSGRWANPFWRVYDFAMLLLALLHGWNGLRVIVDDYARSGYRRLLYQVGLATIVCATLLLGSLTIFVFTPKG
jgi:succinate dehydrogenase / fumarate reductase, membrane anchor subunit